MKILFLGYVTSRDTVKKLSAGSVPGNKMQINILENLNMYEDIKLEIISVVGVAPFPKDKKIFIRNEEIELSENLKAIKVGFLNIPFIKQLWQAVSVYNHARRIIKKDKDYIVFSYNLFPQMGIPVMMLKKRFNCKTVSLLADLPIDDNYTRRGISKLFRSLYDYLARKAILYCGNLIVLNKNAILQFAPNANYTVIDGGVDAREVKTFSQAANKGKKNKNIVYSGSLSPYSGIMNLIEAMKRVKNKEIVLDIYGSGLLAEEVKRSNFVQANIKYYGKVDNKTMQKIQSQAYLLANPRPVDDPISQVTFPSKIFEYMLSGTPVLTTRLNGFTEDYFDKMYFAEDNSPKAIAEKIDEIFLKPWSELKCIAGKAREFVLSHKTWEKQTNKIYSFLKELH